MNASCNGVDMSGQVRSTQWRNDGVAAASSDGGPTGGRGPPTVLEFLVINFSVCLLSLSNCYIIIYCIVWFQVHYFKSKGRGPDLRK